MKVLGIESSADETSAAVVEDGFKLLSNVVLSSIDLNKVYGGIVPEIAARSHLEVILPVIDEALAQAGCTWADIDAIAVTQGPGLGGSLLIGMMSARTLAIALDKPLFPVNHVEAHIYANFITRSAVEGYQLAAKAPSLPLLALIVSGGHSHIVLLRDHGDYEVVGRTLDDAVGEAFDKVAKMLGLPYPGGPAIAKIAGTGNAEAYKFPKAQTPGDFNFSFSGLKTAVLRAAQNTAGGDYTLPSTRLPQLLNDRQKADIAASFQRVAFETLISKYAKAIDKYQPRSVVIGGGVAADRLLRKMLAEKIDYEINYADIRLCTDNAAMVAALAGYRTDNPQNPYVTDIEPDLQM